MRFAITHNRLPRSVTMAQCTRAFVKGEDYGFSQAGSATEAAYA
jgi:NADH dehydrogenase (ubiquinone) Fe-S protein 1